MAQADVSPLRPMPNGDMRPSLSPSAYETTAMDAPVAPAPPRPAAAATAVHNQQRKPLPRAASFTHIPTLSSNPTDLSMSMSEEHAERFSLERSLSDVFNPSAVSLASSSSSPDVTPRGTPQRGNSPVRTWAGRRKSSGIVPQITISKFASKGARQLGEKDTSYKGSVQDKTAKAKPRTISDSFASFARRPWTSSSRSPSPNSRDGEDSGPDDGASTAPSSISSSSPRKASMMPQDSERSSIAAPDAPAPVLVRKGTLLLGKTRKPATRSSDVKGDADSSRVERHSMLLPKSFSTDKLPGLGKTFTRKDTSASRSVVAEKSPTVRSFEPMRKKDELWSTFRNLESEFQKFDTKPSALKVNVVRSSLLPFLRSYAVHPSNQTLRPEGLDRRTTILDKWWTGLLDMLDGANKTIAGTDRPAVLEALSGIMTRPEWRLSPSLSPLFGGHALQNTIRSKSSSSLDSSQSEFWVESVHHNVRNLFVQNLQRQMAIVVNHMSLRSAPASLVSWSGKAIAYAFFFCPGVADALVRLWGVPPDAIRRVVDSFEGLKEDAIEAGLADEVVANFPGHLHSLRCSSFAATVRNLRRRAPLPLSLRNVQWDGPWKARWCGRDSDLLFVFFKHWHILFEDFVAPDAALSHKVASPAFVVVNAQVLTVLDSTIHRQSNQATATNPSPTFDDVLESPDSTAAALPLPASNITRLMAENRLVMLLRDFLSESSSEFRRARQTFAEAFTCLLRAAARKTSVFNHSACSTLCDFMEEALFIFVRYQRTEPSSKRLVDWAFWLDACKEMAKSQNTSTETRLFTFLYSIWSIVAADEELKEKVCLGWLLTETTFDDYFTHWCPMNRALFMRLICWRVARYSQLETELDRSIVQALSGRLDSAWHQYLRVQEQADANKTRAISTAPCNPVPGRRLLIVRNDMQAVPGNVFFTFDGAFSPSLPRHPRPKAAPPALPYRSPEPSRTPTEHPSPSLGSEHKEPLADVDTNRKKRWSIFRNTKILTPPEEMTPTPPIKASIPPQDTNHNPQDMSTKPNSVDEQIFHAPTSNPHEHHPTQRPNTSPTLNPHPSHHPKHAQKQRYTHHSFKFSLALADRTQGPPRDRRLRAPKLPYPAHTLLSPPPVESEPDDMLGRPGPGEESGESGGSSVRATYVGRALAEWTVVVGECHAFFERRRGEGVPSNALVETPMLGVESLRGGVGRSG